MSPIPADRRGPGSRVPPPHGAQRHRHPRCSSPLGLRARGPTWPRRERQRRGGKQRTVSRKHREQPWGGPGGAEQSDTDPYPAGSRHFCGRRKPPPPRAEVTARVPPPLSLRASLPPPSRRRRHRSRARLAAARGAAGRDHGGRRGPHRHLRRCGRGIQPGTRGRRARRGPSPPFPSLARLRRRAACRALSAAAAPLTPPLFGRLRRRAFPPPHAARGTGRASGPSPPAGPLGERRPALPRSMRGGGRGARGAAVRRGERLPSLLPFLLKCPRRSGSGSRPQWTGPSRMRSGEQLLPGGRGEIQPLFANGGKKLPSGSGFSVDLCGGGGTSAALFLQRWRNYLPF